MLFDSEGSPSTPAECSIPLPPPGIVHIHAFGQALELFFDQVLERVVLMSQLRKHLLVLSQLRFHGLKLFELGGIHPHVFALPVVEGRIADLVLAADLFDLKSAFLLLEDFDDLDFCESGFFHAIQVKGFQSENSKFEWLPFQGSLQPI